MKRIFYNSKLAHVLLSFSGCSTITLGPFVFSILSKRDMSQSTRNHECTHSRQWIELTVLSGLILWMLVIGWDISAWWISLATASFYILYFLEWLIRFIVKRDWNKAYRSVSFEQEAYVNAYDANYNESCSYFSWVKYLF